jgi:hypothetical protein
MAKLWQRYRRLGVIDARPYVPRESLVGISVSAGDRARLDSPTIRVRGMICRNPFDPSDQWFVNQAYFDAHYAPEAPEVHAEAETQLEPAPSEHAEEFPVETQLETASPEFPVETQEDQPE